MTAHSKLFSIGYEGHTPEDFFAALTAHKITVLVDVRRNAISHKKGFAKTALSQACEAHGIKYQHLPQLGISSDKRKGFTTREQYDKLFEKYAREWLPKETATLETVRGWVDSGERVALMCFEHEHQNCHRHCVADALEMKVQPL